MYDHKTLCKKILNLGKALDEYIQDFQNRFIHISFEFIEYVVDLSFLVDKFLYLVHISDNLHELEPFEPLPTYLGIRASKYATDEVVVPGDSPSPSH